MLCCCSNALRTKISTYYLILINIISVLFSFIAIIVTSYFASVSKLLPGSLFVMMISTCVLALAFSICGILGPVRQLQAAQLDQKKCGLSDKTNVFLIGFTAFQAATFFIFCIIMIVAAVYAQDVQSLAGIMIRNATIDTENRLSQFVDEWLIENSDHDSEWRAIQNEYHCCGWLYNDVSKHALEATGDDCFREGDLPAQSTSTRNVLLNTSTPSTSAIHVPRTCHVVMSEFVLQHAVWLAVASALMASIQLSAILTTLQLLWCVQPFQELPDVEATAWEMETSMGGANTRYGGSDNSSSDDDDETRGLSTAAHATTPVQVTSGGGTLGGDGGGDGGSGTDPEEDEDDYSSSIEIDLES